MPPKRTRHCADCCQHVAASGDQPCACGDPRVRDKHSINCHLRNPGADDPTKGPRKCGGFVER
jgi:hypothetical protein